MPQEIVYRARYDNSIDGRGPDAKVYAAGFFLTEDEAWNWLDKNYNPYDRPPANGWKSDSQYMCGVESLFYHYGEVPN